MLKIVLFGYSRGLVSSRRIANACETNITFMSLSGDEQPHFTSIARFIAKMKDQIESLFTQVLMISNRKDLVDATCLRLRDVKSVLMPVKGEAACYMCF